MLAELGDGGNKRFGVFMARGSHNLFRAAGFYDFSVPHDGDTVGNLRNEVDVMADKDDWKLALLF